MHFENCGSSLSPLLVLIVSLGIDVKLVQEGLEITLVLDVQNTSLEVHSGVQILVDVSLYWQISAYFTD